MAGMHIDIIAVGKLKERYWTEACSEYLKRLTRYAQVQVLEVADCAAAREQDVQAAIDAEDVAIARKLKPSGLLVALDSAGKQLSSEKLAAQIGDWQLSGSGHVSFIIGGSWGLSKRLKQRADLLLSLGAITLPHNLARVVLLEQLYRSFRILAGEPYHK